MISTQYIHEDRDQNKVAMHYFEVKFSDEMKVKRLLLFSFKRTYQYSLTHAQTIQGSEAIM